MAIQLLQKFRYYEKKTKYFGLLTIHSLFGINSVLKTNDRNMSSVKKLIKQPTLKILDEYETTAANTRLWSLAG